MCTYWSFRCLVRGRLYIVFEFVHEDFAWIVSILLKKCLTSLLLRLLLLPLLPPLCLLLLPLLLLICAFPWRCSSSSGSGDGSTQVTCIPTRPTGRAAR